MPTSYGVDPNGFYRNPQWWWALTNGGGTLLDPCDSCPCGVNSAQLWAESGSCTNQTLHINQGNPLCGGYHMNWFPVEIDGSLGFEDHDNAIAGDNDYEFDIRGPDQSLVTANRSSVHLEFNASETVDDWDGTGTWWEYFHHQIVDAHWNDKAYREQWFGTRYGIVIGMLGIDEEHADHHSELHPVYAMFIKLPPSSPLAVPKDQEDHWTFFVRNWGNEGYCGPGDEPLTDYRQLQIHIGGGALLAANVSVYAHGAATLFADEYSIDQCFAQSSVIISSDGFLTFNLPPAIGKCGFVGDLTVKSSPLVIETRPPGSAGSARIGAESRTAPSATPPRANREKKDFDPVLAAKIEKLSASDRHQLDQQLSALTKPATAKPAVRRINLQKTTVPAVRGQHPPVTTQTFKAAPNPHWQAMEEHKRQLIENFLKEHHIQ